MATKLPLNLKKHLIKMMGRLDRWKVSGEAEKFDDMAEGFSWVALLFGIAQDWAKNPPIEVRLVQTDDAYYELGDLWIVDLKDGLACCVGGLDEADNGDLVMEIFDS